MLYVTRYYRDIKTFFLWKSYKIGWFRVKRSPDGGGGRGGSLRKRMRKKTFLRSLLKGQRREMVSWLNPQYTVRRKYLIALQ